MEPLYIARARKIRVENSLNIELFTPLHRDDSAENMPNFSSQNEN